MDYLEEGENYVEGDNMFSKLFHADNGIDTRNTTKIKQTNKQTFIK